jgi:hypothetical protein
MGKRPTKKELWGAQTQRSLERSIYLISLLDNDETLFSRTFIRSPVYKPEYRSLV